MTIIPVSDIDSADVLSVVYKHLKNDGLIIYPTDTLYGIGCDFYSNSARDKIDKFKGRSATPYSVIVSGRKMIRDLTDQSLSLFELFTNYHSSEKMTFLFKLNKKINNEVVKGSDLIGIRLPGKSLLRKMVELLGFPIVSTSVNISGTPPVNHSERIVQMIRSSQFSSEIIFIDAGDLPESKGSTILDISGNKPVIVREGDDPEPVKNFIRDYQKKILNDL